MNGIVFFKTRDLERLRKFYLEMVECSVWMDQEDCVIFCHGEFLFGFCKRDTVDKCGILTFFYNEKEKVDFFYEKFSQIADGEPRDNPKYPIYHFFTEDPEGRVLEFQYFYNI
ncbi:VOC family protein [Candidatus Cloacimonadota bacterium]